MGLSIVSSMRRSFDRLLDPEPLARATVEAPARSALLRRYGDFTLAYSLAQQPGLEYFGDRQGFIGFGRKMGCTVALGDPLAADTHREALVSEFTSEFPRAVFVQASRPLAEILIARGYTATPMGVDHVVDLKSQTFAGKQGEKFRYAANWLTRRNFSLREMTYAELGRPRARRLSVAWRRTRTVRRREVQFVNRPLVFRDEPETRKFFLFDGDNTLVAFVGLDPLYQQGIRRGYCTAFKRRLPDAPSATEQGMMKMIIDQLRLEGTEELRLGLSPLAKSRESSCSSSLSGVHPVLNRMFRWGFDANWLNRRYYNVRGHAQYKRRFGGREIPQYYCAPAGSMTGLWALLATLRLSKLI